MSYFDKYNIEFTKGENKKIYDVIISDKETNLLILGQFLFSFDGKKIFNFWSDYPEKLNDEQMQLFNKEYSEKLKYFIKK